MRNDFIRSLLTALMLSLAFPPFKLGVFAYWALVPFFYLLEKKDLKDAGHWGFLTGLFISLTTGNWLFYADLPGMLAAVLIQPVYYLLYAILHVLLFRKLGMKFLIVLPVLWTVVEYLKSLSGLDLNRVTLGYTHPHYLFLIQKHSYLAIYLLSFWMATLNVLIYAILKNLESRRRVVLLLFVIMILFFLPWLFVQQQLQIREVFEELVDFHFKRCWA
jgi:apolipoprotein N-acyltransferase